MAVLPADQDKDPISDRKASQGGSARAAVRVWMQLLALLIAVGLFGWIIMRLTLSLR